VNSLPPPSRPGPGQWLALLAGAVWLAVVPLAVTAALAAVTHQSPAILVQVGAVVPRNPILPEWAFGLLTTALSLGLNLLVSVPLYLATRREGRRFLHTAATLLIAIALVQTLNALASLACGFLPGVGFDPLTSSRTCTAALRLALVLPFLLLGLEGLDARRQNVSLRKAWRRVGLRLWFNPTAIWLALVAGAAIVWPWVLVGSLGSPGMTAANLLQSLPNALSEQILFRGLALVWLRRAARGRTRAAAASLILFVAAQGGTVLPTGDWAALLRFGAAVALGLLSIELTIRAGGSVWPAVVVHFLYDWFHYAFADPRSTEEVLHWLVQVWAPLAAGGMGLLFWLGRKAVALIARPVARPRPARRARGGLVAAAGLAVVAWLGIGALYLTQGAPGFHPDGFLIFLEEQADLGPAADIADPVERRAWVYGTLVETAERSQAPLRAELERRGIAYRPHYLINLIEVQGRPGLRRAFAGEPGVASVLFQPGVRRYPRSFLVPNMDTTGPSGVEWNVQQVGADRVWELGYTGQGVIVGDADTGVAWDHPALRDAYLGWQEGRVDHNYHWYDPWDGRLEPWDDSGHGTHTTGTVVGRDGENEIGLAPGARWIACRNMRHGIGNPGSYLSCMEFLLAPFPLDGDPFHDGDSAQGAHVVNNSWGCPRQEGCLADTLRIAAQNLRAAGQMMVVSAGNDGPTCGTVQDAPAPYDVVFTVGAVDRADQAASFSSRGPATADGTRILKPDIVAPGVNIRSSVPGGYASLLGTSMAGPHVAGAVALLWSADPALVGDIDRSEVLLVETAQPLTVDAVCPEGGGGWGTVCACGNDLPDSVPNEVYGWGQVDAWAAVQQQLGER
jgi:subtilisin family serine protease